MAEDRTGRSPEPWKAMSKQERREERMRLTRLGRLPFLYDLALRGSGPAFLATLVQVLLSAGPVLVVAKAVTGRWLPPGIALAVLVVAFALQGLSRYLNAKAGRG